MAITYAPGRIKITADEDDVPADHYLIHGISWSGAANTNNLTLQDQDDFDIWKAKANTGQLDMQIKFDPPLQVQEIKTDVLDGGEVLIYV